LEVSAVRPTLPHFFNFPLDRFRERLRLTRRAFAIVRACGPERGCEPLLELASLREPTELPEAVSRAPGPRKSTAYIPFMEHQRSLQSIPDDELLRRLAEILRQSRRVEADLVAHIGEVEERKLYAREASLVVIRYAICIQ
jgi:hypothetical protein